MLILGKNSKTKRTNYKSGRKRFNITGSKKTAGGKPEETIVIEDSFNGIRAAHAAGMKPIMVPDIIQPDDEMREKAWKIFSDLKQVSELL